MQKKSNRRGITSIALFERGEEMKCFLEGVKDYPKKSAYQVDWRIVS
ncbi:hypothetical protein [Vibrio penaeicida]|nr:hypothetical protein [Vibrio penaeicida]